MIGKRPAGVPDHPNFNLLRRDDSLIQTNLGGRFSLPREFETTKLASGFYLEGQEAHAMRSEQVLIGTALLAPGWEPWKYPQYSDEAKKVAHPLAGKLHKVAGTKEGENYILMCRPLEVQIQVNHAFGVASIERMTAEQRGETLTLGPDAAGDPGMLTDARLREEIGVERDNDELSGRSTAVHAQPAGIGRQQRRISR